MSRPVKGRHQARKRAVDLLFEAEARGLSPAEVADVRTALAEANPDVAPLHPYTALIHTLHADDFSIDGGKPLLGIRAALA